MSTEKILGDIIFTIVLLIIGECILIGILFILYMCVMYMCRSCGCGNQCDYINDKICSICNCCYKKREIEPLLDA